MGWYIRKSVQLGAGLRLNLSKSGIGFSAGVRGCRVSTGPSGSYINIGGHGIYYRQRIGGPYGQVISPQPVPNSFQHPPTSLPPLPHTVPTADAEQLVDLPSAGVLSLINACSRAPRYAITVLVLGIILALGSLSVSPFLSVVIGSATVGVACWANQTDIERRTYGLVFQLDAASYAWWQKFSEAVSILGQGHYLWRINDVEPTGDWKRNAGASTLVNRIQVRLTKSNPPIIKSNIIPFCLDLGAQQLFFLPDRLYVYQQGTYGAVCYSDLWLDNGQTNFVEDEAMPQDTRVVGETWAHPNKDGSPDRRFGDNSRLPICEYGLVALRSPQGLGVVLETSAVGTAQRFVHSIREAISQAPSVKKGNSTPPPVQSRRDTANRPAGSPPLGVPLPPQRMKECPRCGRAANLTAHACVGCGHQYRTRFP